MTGDANRKPNIAAARPAGHASRIEASRARLSESRRICRSTAVIIREARVTINRTLEMLGIGFPPDSDNWQKRAGSHVPRGSLRRWEPAPQLPLGEKRERCRH